MRTSTETAGVALLGEYIVILPPVCLSVIVESPMFLKEVGIKFGLQGPLNSRHPAILVPMRRTTLGPKG